MSFGIAILLTEKNPPIEDYSLFLDECARIGGQWQIHEHKPFDPNSDEIVYDCVLIAKSGQRTREKRRLSVWITLSRENQTRKYGKDRRKIYWIIYIETKAGRGLWSLAVQMIIPLKAFSIFRDIVVIVDPERVFLEPKTYREFAMRELMNEFGKEALQEAGLLDEVMSDDV